MGTKGLPIAEWLVQNSTAMRIKYVIWAQRIFNCGRDGRGFKSWSQWRVMEDRGSITQNHFDHVHVSFA